MSLMYIHMCLFFYRYKSMILGFKYSFLVKRFARVQNKI